MLSPPVLILEELDALSVARHCLRSYIHTRLCATCTPLSSQLSIQYSVRRSEYPFTLDPAPWSRPATSLSDSCRFHLFCGMWRYLYRRSRTALCELAKKRLIAAARRAQRAQGCGMRIASAISAVSGIRCSWSVYSGGEARQGRGAARRQGLRGQLGYL